MKEFAKAKTASKTITYEGDRLKQSVLSTMSKASALVGSTLGPHGRVVLIERSENLPPFATKDGITVFNSMAFSDPTSQVILEAARDSSAKTNLEAGDGTTTATILAEALIRRGFQYLQENPRLSVQKVMRELEVAFSKIIVPFIKERAVKITNDNNNDLLYKVALIATNNDIEMSTAVIKSFKMVGHNGNVTIAETPGVGGFEVEKIEGFPIARGFEDTCGRFLEEFINDKPNYRTVLDRPRFILYDGKVNDISTLLPIIEKIGEASDSGKYGATAISPNVIVVAHHFSEAVLATLANNFKNPETINVIPLKTFMTHQPNSPYHFLGDMAAFTGATVFNPLHKPLETAQLVDLGVETMAQFEFYRYRSLVLGRPNDLLILQRAEELEQQLKQAESSLDVELLTERVALLTGGIARLKVFGSSEAELKEKKHRVEDAVASVKGALRDGVLPGCGKTLLSVSKELFYSDESDSVKKILGYALLEPLTRLLENGGNSRNEIASIRENMYANLSYVQPASRWERFKNYFKRLFGKPENKTTFYDERDFFFTYDAMNFKFGDAVQLGVVDSASAVLMAIKNSLSVAKMLMGLSGTVVFKRDNELDEAQANSYHDERRAISEALERQEQETWEPPSF